MAGVPDETLLRRSSWLMNFSYALITVSALSRSITRPFSIQIASSQNCRIWVIECETSSNVDPEEVRRFIRSADLAEK